MMRVTPCDECDPSFDCFDGGAGGAAPCRKKPLSFVAIQGTDIFAAVYDGAPCIVCGRDVEPGTGARAIPPLPAMHTTCMLDVYAVYSAQRGEDV